jgi:hypothetical protein
MGAVHIAGLEHLSPSGASVLVDCERKYWHNYAEGLGRDERSEPLAMGGGLAEALEFGLECGLAEYRERRPVGDDGWTDPVAYERDGWIGEATITLALDGYRMRYPGPVEREVTHFCALPGTTRLLQVRIDGVALGHLVEDKLRSGRSMTAETLENEVLQGRQISAELYGHWRATGEILPLHLRCTKKCDPRKLKKLETQAEVEAVLAEHFANDGVFVELIATRTVKQLLEFETEFAALAIRAEALLESDTPTGARNPSSCHMYGRTCPALRFCTGLAVHPTQEIHGTTD